MSHAPDPEPQIRTQIHDVEEKRGAAEWIAAGAATADLAITAWQAFGPSSSEQAPPPPSPSPSETPKVILPSGVDPD